MELGDTVQYQGRRYLLHGFTHAGSPEQHGVIEDAQTGEFVTVPLEQVAGRSGGVKLWSILRRCALCGRLGVRGFERSGDSWTCADREACAARRGSRRCMPVTYKWLPSCRRASNLLSRTGPGTGQVGCSDLSSVRAHLLGLADYEVNEILEVFADCEDAEKMLRECLSERAGVGRDLGELEAASAVWPHRGSPPRGSKKGLPRQGARQRAVEVSGEREHPTPSSAQRPYRPSAALT